MKNEGITKNTINIAKSLFIVKYHHKDPTKLRNALKNDKTASLD
ncbi:MAG: hypothetical protein ACHQ1H_05195 [Nitrososphaerales archaeon]